MRTQNRLGQLLRVLTVSLATLPYLALPQAGRPASRQVEKTIATVNIDCNSGDSVQDALAFADEVLEIQFSGTCVGDIVFDRGNVSLHGGDPDRGATIVGHLRLVGPFEGPAGPNNLENFTVRDGDPYGIAVANSVAFLDDISVIDAVGTGISVYPSGSSARLTDCTIHGSDSGILSAGGAHVELSGTILASNNARAGIALGTGGGLLARATELDVSHDGATIDLSNNLVGLAISGNGNMLLPHLTTINAHDNTFGVLVRRGGVLILSGQVNMTANDNSEIGVVLIDSGTLVFDEGEQELTATGNRIGLFMDDSSARIANATIKDNTGVDVSLNLGARATFEGTLDIGTLTCSDHTALTRGGPPCEFSDGFERGDTSRWSRAANAAAVLGQLGRIDVALRPPLLGAQHP